MIALLLYGFFYLDLHEFLTIDGIKSSLDEFNRWYTAHPLQTGAAFFGFYVLVAALSLPGAVVMTLVAGTVFGLAWGTLIVSFASSIGATLAFLVSRYLLRDAVQNRFGERLRAMNEGIRKEGAYYLFTLRLVPVFPFFLINLLMGLTPIRTPVFYWVSQTGMLAGTVVYVNAGAQLASLDSLSGILSPPLIFSFVLLGIFPLLAKNFLATRHYRKP